MKKIIYILFVGLMLFAAPGTDFAQEQVTLAKTVKPDDKDSKEFDKENKDTNAKNESDDKVKSDSRSQTNSGSTSCESCRWFEPTVASVSFRYRTITDSNATRTFNQGQQRVLLGGKFKFDKEGKYTVNVQASSGYYFNWAYADIVGGGMKKAYFKGGVGAGLDPAFARIISETAPNSGGYNLFVRQLYFSAKPVKGLELQFGSLPILHGQNSETTSFDDDGYVAGERVSVKRPDKFFFDEISATYGFLGKTDRVKSNGEREIIDDVYTPNLFHRWKHFGNSNYHQFLVQKKIGKRAVVSADYTFLERTDVIREAIKINTPELKVFDFIRFETYQRIGDNKITIPSFFPGQSTDYTVKAASGFSIHGEKKFFKRLSVGGGYNNIDYDYSNNQNFYTIYNFSLNGDRMGVGKRVYFTTDLKLTDELSLTSFGSFGFGVPTGVILFNKTHLNMAINFDILKSVKKHFGWFK